MALDVLAAVWVFCGALTGGITFAYFDGKYPGNKRESAGVAVLMSFFGPIGLFISICLSEFCRYGIRWW